MKMAFKFFRVLGGSEKFNQKFDKHFSFTKGNNTAGLFFAYVDFFPCEECDCEKETLVEVGRCEIGPQWGTPWLWVNAFEIADDYRLNGYGETFFKELKRFAKNHGFLYIWLNSRDDSAREFWIKQGGVPVSDLDNIYLVPPDLDGRHLVFDLNVDDTIQGA